MLKIEEVKAGDELECVDHKGFTSGKRAVNEPILEMKEIIVQSISSKNLIYVHDKNNSDNFFIYESELKYFKKKEQSQQYTFFDLIDVAVQAKKDRLLGQLVIMGSSIHYFYNGSEFSYDERYVENGIKHIQSLYKETFVIESEEDIKRIIKGARITLTNDNLLTAKNTYCIVEDHIVIDAYTDECATCQNLNYNVGIVFLKGATVEQERGRDDHS